MEEIVFELDLGGEVFWGGGGTAHLDKKNSLLTIPIFFLFLLFSLCHSFPPPFPSAFLIIMMLFSKLVLLRAKLNARVESSGLK